MLQGTTGNIKARPDRGERETVIDSVTTDYREKKVRERERGRGEKTKRS